jgi:acetylornithine deacetylase/succinyl-diaminopimelate desuccinylase-like protein
MWSHQMLHSAIVALEGWSRVAAEVDAAVDRGMPDLFAALAIPSVSHNAEALRQSAHFLTDLFERDGWSVEQVSVGGNLILLAEIGSGPHSLVVYGHHDVQPVEPLDAWTSPPFEPVIRDGRIYGRGSADNKGQFFCHIFAVRALRHVLGEVPVRVKLVLDGQEEAGSPHLADFVDSRREALEGAVLCFTADGPTRQEGRPEVVFGVRGVLKIAIRVRTANTDLHSGNWGNIVPSAAWRLAHILSQLKGSDGRVTVPGFYDHVVPPNQLERQAMADFGYDVAEAGRSVGAVRLDGPADVPALERLMFMPALTVNGLEGGHRENNVIPCEATAFIDVRLVANQDPEWMFGLLRRHLHEIAPDATLERPGGEWYLPSRTPLDLPLAAHVVDAVRVGFGSEPLLVPSSGGTLPDAIFARRLGIPALDVPYAGRDQRNHAPNENMRLDHLHAGSRTSAALFLSLAER